MLIQLFHSSAGWIYVCDGINYKTVDIAGEKPKHDIFVDDTYDWVDHAINKNGCNVTAAYEITYCNDDRWSDMEEKVSNSIDQIHKSE